MSRTASSAAAQPAASSWAPTARSQLSRCPPTRTISFGSSAPVISPTALAETTVPSARQSIRSVTRASGSPFRSALSFSASAVLTAAAGTRGTPGLYLNMPVWGCSSIRKVRERTMTPTAPRAAAAAAPSTRWSAARP